MNYSINHELCNNCKLCIEVCPCDVIEINGKEEVYFVPERIAICQNCGQCMAVCSKKAITANGFSYERDFSDLPQTNVDYQNFIDFLSTRRSIRNFKKKPVSDEIIEKILDAVSFAPYGADPEEMCVTVVNNREVIESALPYMNGFLENIVKWMENPIMSYMIKRGAGKEQFNTVKHHLYPIVKRLKHKLKTNDRVTRNAPAIVIFHAKTEASSYTHNSLIFASYIMLAAHSLGLGATMIGIVPPAINKVKEVREIFKIPKENEAVMSVILGYPKFRYKRTVKREQLNVEWVN